MEVFVWGWAFLIPLAIWLFIERMKWQMRYRAAKKNLEDAEKAKIELESFKEEMFELRAREREIQAKLSEQQKAHEEKLKLLEETKQKFAETFKALSYEAIEKLRKSSKEEMTERESAINKLMNPIKEGLTKLETGMQHIEKERKGEREAFKEHVRQIVDSEKSLKDETANLVKALRKPEVRGMWGELQLKRVVELSGMMNYCDFYEQRVSDSDENRQRPDVIVKMPGDRQIIVDAKAPFEAFLEANHEAEAQARETKLKTHAKHIRQHILQLGKKSYWENFPPTPEFVVLFLPAEVFFSAALQYDPTLIELGAQQGVILATPMTLIGLLRSVAYGWKQDRFSKHAETISQLGHELYKRLSDMSKHWGSVGRSLGQAVEGYNKAMGSYERRVLSTARKFKELGAASEELDIDPMQEIEKLPRKLASEAEEPV